MREKAQNARNEALATVSAAKKEYEQKQAKLQKSIDAANDREQQAKKQIDEESSRINALAEAKIASTKSKLNQKYEEDAWKQKSIHERKIKALETEYKKKTGLFFSLLVVSVYYSIIATLFTAVNSPRFFADINDVCKLIGGFFSGLFTIASGLASAAWSLHDAIPYPVVNAIFPGILAALGFIIIFFGILALIGFGLYKVSRLYVKNFGDILSVTIALSSLVVLVWFADHLSFIKWNLILVFIIIHVIYVVIRLLWKRHKAKE